MKTQIQQFIENIVHLVCNGSFMPPSDTVKHPRYVPLPVGIKTNRYGYTKRNNMG